MLENILFAAFVALTVFVIAANISKKYRTKKKKKGKRKR